MNVTQTNHTSTDMTEQIQDIIASLGIEIIESSAPNEDNSYTTQLELKGYDWTVCGYGQTSDISRSDAYLRLITDLQHLNFPAHVYSILNRRYSFDLNFCYPDAHNGHIRKRPIQEPLLQDITTAIREKEGEEYDLREIKRYLNNWADCENYLSYVPFYSVKMRKSINLSHRVVTHLCYPNGVATADTYEEALSTALIGEIKRYFERAFAMLPTSNEADAWRKWGCQCPELYKEYKKIETPNGKWASKEGIARLIKICLTFAPDVYIRDNGYLGIPSVCVYLPGITPIFREDIFPQGMQMPYKKEEILYAVPEYNVAFWSTYSYELMDLYEEKYSLIFSDFSCGSYKELLAAFHVYIGDTISALNELYEEPNPDEHIRAIICELEMKVQGVEISKRNTILKLFFGKKYIQFIQKNWRDRFVHSRLFELIISNTLGKDIESAENLHRYRTLVLNIRDMMKRYRKSCTLHLLFE